MFDEEANMKNLEQKLWRKARFAASILKIIPNLKAVAVTGSLALGRANKNSDIDFLIVAKDDRIWTIRFFSTLLLHVLGLRRYKNKIAGRICLNWYLISSKYPQATIGWPVKVIWRRKNGKMQKSKCKNQLENFLRAKQIERIKKDPRTWLRGSRVKFENDEIGFWPEK